MKSFIFRNLVLQCMYINFLGGYKMKKILKAVGAVAAIGAGVAAGLVIYSKIKKGKEDVIDEFDDYDDDFSDEEDVVDAEEEAAEE